MSAKQQISTVLYRVAPRSTAALARRVRRPKAEALQRQVDHLNAEIIELRAEIDELRRDNIRIAELYDLVFERLSLDTRA